MAIMDEAAVEVAAMDWLKAQGYATAHGADIAPEGARPERSHYKDVILRGRFEDALRRLNPNLPPETLESASLQVRRADKPSLIEENRRLHTLMTDGVPVEWRNAQGERRHDSVRLIDFDKPAGNDWLAVNQFTVIEGQHNRRPDIVLFVNGLPLAVIELKNPAEENATLQGAYNQLQTYKAQIPSLFSSNAALVIADGFQARIGSLTASMEWFKPWRQKPPPATSSLELKTLISRVFTPDNFLTLMREFTVFAASPSGLNKIIAGWHQCYAVREAVERTIKASRSQGDRKIGVVWHTQGSGKSLLMAFYAGQIVKHPLMKNPTLIIITDRKDLDDQLFETFANCRDLIRQKPQQAGSREELKNLLNNRQAGGVIFTTIQKFLPPQSPAEPQNAVAALTTRRNIVVIADEAHRSQYGLRRRIRHDTGAFASGFAQSMRDALPNASFIGFTGTPIEQEDRNTPAVFGRYVDIYDIKQSVKDGATVPIYYESRLARLELNRDEIPAIDDEITAITEDETIEEQERLKRKWATVEALAGAEKRLRRIADDLIAHAEERFRAQGGKAMAVCMSRRICVALYDQIIRRRPGWHGVDERTGGVKVVMTGDASDAPAWRDHIRNKEQTRAIAARFKNPDDPLQLVIVRDMWLTGFDVPPLHTLYIDKPMRGHNLMQAIARVNRVFRDKPGGLVVDYIGVAQYLKTALRQYSSQDRRYVGLNEADAVALMVEKYEIVRAMLHGFDYRRALTGAASARLAVIAAAMDWILARQKQQADRETDQKRKKLALRRYQDAVFQLSRAFALAAASDKARAIRDDVALFQAVRAALVKGDGRSAQSLDAAQQFAIRQLVDKAIVSTDIVDILAATGFEKANIAILSDAFLQDMARMKHKNLAVEALKRLLNDEIRSRSRTNIVESRAFSARLESAMARYHANALTTAQVIQELIHLARAIHAARQRGAESNLSEDEIAFYDALAQNKSAVEVMGDDKLKVIAHKVLTSLKRNITVDWARMESTRARMRLRVKDILRCYGYPPDLQSRAVQTVLEQAEVWSAAWAATFTRSLVNA